MLQSWKTYCQTRGQFRSLQTHLVPDGKRENKVLGTEEELYNFPGFCQFFHFLVLSSVILGNIKRVLNIHCYA